MKFTVSTAPLKSGLNLGIINANVTKFEPMSTVVQITADGNNLRINTGAVSILSELRYKGVNDGVGADAIIVDCVLFKQLISSISSLQVELEITENKLIVHAGKSTYVLPRSTDVEDAQFPRPDSVSDSELESAIEMSRDDWKFVKEHQMYARGDSETQPVYNYVWVGKSGDVIVSDYTRGLFTHSDVGHFDTSCLLQESVVNLLNAIPDGAKMIRTGDSYAISVANDGYEYIATFRPRYESEATGSYNAEIIMDMMFDDDRPTTTVNVCDITTALNQAAMLTTDKESEIYLEVDTNCVRLHDSNVNCVLPATGTIDVPYEIRFYCSDLKIVMSKCSESYVDLSPVYNAGVASGVVVQSGHLSVAVTGVC